MTDKERILAFIEKRIKWNEDWMKRDPKPSDIGRIEEAKCIRRFIDSQPAQEEDPVSEDLEKVADQYSQGIESDYTNDMFDRGDIYEAVIYGAQWQKQQIIQKACKWLDGNTSPYFTIIKNPGLAKVNINFFNDKFLEDFRKAMED